MPNHKYIYYLLLFCRYSVGLLFIFSGIIKLNDPVGTQIKMEEYFEVFGTHFLTPYALYISVFMCVAEVALGFALLLFYRMWLTAPALLALIVFFTFLTFYSAYFNKVTDCGCFGDFIKLKPWTSFWKDIILLTLILPLFVWRKHLKGAWNTVSGDVMVASATFLSLLFAIYCIEHLSVWDFRAYKVGNNIASLMRPSCPPKYNYIMVKDNKEYVFEQYPTDTTYQFKDMKLTNPDCLPKITDYSLWNDEGDFTQNSFDGKKLFIIILNTNHAFTPHIPEIKRLIDECQATNIEPFIITASGKEAIASFISQHQLKVPYYFADGVVIKTIIRSNPGIVLLQNGTVMGKWHHNDVPQLTDLQKLLP